MDRTSATLQIATIIVYVVGFALINLTLRDVRKSLEDIRRRAKEGLPDDEH